MTLTGDYTHNPGCECNGDLSPTTRRLCRDEAPASRALRNNFRIADHTTLTLKYRRRTPNRVGPSCMYHASLYDDMHDCGVGNQGTCKSMARSVELTRSGRHNVSLRCERCPDLSRRSQDPGSSIRNRRRERRVAQLFQARAGIVPELAL